MGGVACMYRIGDISVEAVGYSAEVSDSCLMWCGGDVLIVQLQTLPHVPVISMSH